MDRKNHFIFYLFNNDKTILIARVLHTKRDIQKILTD